jgi:hypothetical protein
MPRIGDRTTAVTDVPARLFVLWTMQNFRILYFRGSALDRVEEVRVRDMLEAIEEAASRKSADLRAEVWSAGRRVGRLDPSPFHLP